MILCDTGIIVAAILLDDTHHLRVLKALSDVREPLVTTSPCITEAMYLLGRSGPPAQEKLRRQIETGILSPLVAALEDAVRACALMRQYADTPMDFADASLVAAAESLNIRRILTLDHHFYAYRIHGKTPFDVMP